MAATTRAETNRFLNSVTVKRLVTHKAKSLYARQLAPDFNPFEFIKNDELGLSRVIGWMLNRDGSHSQSSTFLQLFVERFKIPWSIEVCDASITRMEVWIDGSSRIDVLVESEANEYAIAIENNPFAGDMKDQLARYFKYLDSRKLKHSCLIYLTPQGAFPSDFSITPERAVELELSSRLIRLSYTTQLLAWVNDCRSACGADRVATFLDQFARLIEGSFGGRLGMDEHSGVIEEILSSDENMRSAIEVINAAPAFKIQLLKQFKHDLQAAVGAEGWELHWPLIEKLDFEIDFGTQAAARFRIGAEGSTLYYGAAIKDRNGEVSRLAADAMFDKLSKAIGPNKAGGPPWAWYSACASDRYLDMKECWTNVAQPWLSIRDGSLVLKTTRAASRIREVILP